MNEKFSQHPGQILREDRLGLFTPSPFLPVHFHWTTTDRLYKIMDVMPLTIDHAASSGRDVYAW
jgi:hypothetical protein